jgi:hypothetical protein
MILDIFMDVWLAVQDAEVFVPQMVLQPFGGDPLYDPVTLSIWIDFFHITYFLRVATCRIRRTWMIALPYGRYYKLRP